MIFVVVVFITSAHAEEYTTTPHEFVYCTVCHGVELKGNRSVDAPKLNGLSQWYVSSQLNAFRSGWRGTHEQDPAGIEMMPMAVALTDEQLARAAAYVSAIPIRAAPATVVGNVTRGKGLFSTCVACHGERAEGNESLHAPQLAGQSDWYLAGQLEKYQTGIRGTVSGDTWGAQMRASALELTDERAIADVVAYINTLQKTDKN